MSAGKVRHNLIAWRNGQGFLWYTHYLRTTNKLSVLRPFLLGTLVGVIRGPYHTTVPHHLISGVNDNSGGFALAGFRGYEGASGAVQGIYSGARGKA